MELGAIFAYWSFMLLAMIGTTIAIGSWNTVWLIAMIPLIVVEGLRFYQRVFVQG